VCSACPNGKTSTGQHDASGGNIVCQATTCGPNEKVVNHVCTARPNGKTNTGQYDASGGNSRSLRRLLPATSQRTSSKGSTEIRGEPSVAKEGGWRGNRHCPLRAPTVGSSRSSRRLLSATSQRTSSKGLSCHTSRMW